jgi:hypothetical protein
MPSTTKPKPKPARKTKAKAKTGTRPGRARAQPRPDPLGKYAEKRNFSITAEPAPKSRAAL